MSGVAARGVAPPVDRSQQRLLAGRIEIPLVSGEFGTAYRFDRLGEHSGARVTRMVAEHLAPTSIHTLGGHARSHEFLRGDGVDAVDCFDVSPRSSLPGCARSLPCETPSAVTTGGECAGQRTPSLAASLRTVRPVQTAAFAARRLDRRPTPTGGPHTASTPDLHPNRAVALRFRRGDTLVAAQDATVRNRTTRPMFGSCAGTMLTAALVNSRIVCSVLRALFCRCTPRRIRHPRVTATDGGY